MKIAIQLLKEFGLPFTLSVVWVLYNVFGNEANVSSDIKKIVNIFGPTFFLLSWLVGQFFRVRKQAKIEDSFGSMEMRFSELLAKLESKTDEMIAHVTGGNSFPWLQIGMLDGNTDVGVLVVNHEGDHPLYDVTARIVDLNKFHQIKDNFSFAMMRVTDTNLSIGNLIPSHSSFLSNWKVESIPEQRYNVFFTARNGAFTQLIRLKKVAGSWHCATKVTDNQSGILHEQIDPEYPRNSVGGIDW